MVTVALADGRTYLVRYTFGSLRRLSWEFGIDLLTGVGLDKIDALFVPTLLHLGLQREHPEVTLDYVLDHIDSGHVEDVLLALYADVSGKSREAIVEEAKSRGEAQPKRESGPPVTLNYLWSRAVYDFGVPPAEAWGLCIDEYLALQERHSEAQRLRAQEVALIRTDILNALAKKPKRPSEYFPALFSGGTGSRQPTTDEERQADVAAKVAAFRMMFPPRKREVA